MNSCDIELTKEQVRHQEITIHNLEEKVSVQRRQLADLEERLAKYDLQEVQRGAHERLAIEVGHLCDEKNRAYGNTGTSTGKALAYFYPDGVPVEHYNRMLILARMFDKIARLATLGGGNRALGEDAARDLVGYSLVLCKLLEAEEAE